MARDIAYLGLLDVSERIRRRELSSEEVTRTLLARIERLNKTLNCFQMVLGEQALAAARNADAEIAAGLWRGPLHGVPLGIKDLLFTKGLRVAAGMEILKDFVPDHDSTVVARLKRAGAVLIGKLRMTEGATMDHHPAFGRPVNPWSAAHWTGVSSSGSGVAPAAGLCFGAIGSDTGGSIRMPSAANNLTGVKPSWGRVSRHGIMHLSESLDHLGPMARSTGDAAAILQTIAGADPADPTTLSDPVPDYLAALGRGIEDLVIGVDWRFATDGMPSEIAQAVRHAAEVFQSLGADLREIIFPPFDAGEIMPMMTAEVAVAHAAHYPEKADRYGAFLKTFLDQGLKLNGVTVARAYQARDRFAGALQAIFRKVDLILMPGLGSILPTWDEMAVLANDLPRLTATLLRFTTPMNVARIPTISLPAGFTAQGLPVGVQLAGGALAEADLIRAGAAFQRVTDFHTRRPPID